MQSELFRLTLRRHVAAALDYLANELVLPEPYRNAVESGSLVVRHSLRVSDNCGT